MSGIPKFIRKNPKKGEYRQIELSTEVELFVHVNGGGLIFSKSVPLPDAGRFAFVGEAGTGVRIFTSERRAVILGMRFHHISNGDRTGSNRGLNQFVFYAGFSVFR